jgi:hypothetical protein
MDLRQTIRRRRRIFVGKKFPFDELDNGRFDTGRNVVHGLK